MLVPATSAVKVCTENPLSTATRLTGDWTKTFCKLPAGRKTVAEIGCCVLKSPRVPRYNTELLTVQSKALSTCSLASSLKLKPLAGDIFTLNGRETCTVVKDGKGLVLLDAADALGPDSQARTQITGKNPMSDKRLDIDGAVDPGRFMVPRSWWKLVEARHHECSMDASLVSSCAKYRFDHV